MKKVLFIDRDGTINVEPANDPQIDSLDKLEFVGGVFTWLGKIAREGEYELVMVTNQDGLGTSSFPEETFWPVQNMIIKTLAGEGIKFSDIFVDGSLPEENKPTRKPGTAMLTKYLGGDYDLKKSLVIGDRITDIQLAKNLGAKGILFNSKSSETDLIEKGLREDCALITGSWEAVYQAVKKKRIASRTRTTKETNISVEINLDGQGKASINTGLGFFDHMLEQIAKHAQTDLQIVAQGDLYIDEHHTVEDTAITLGEAFLDALGDKRGIERYGFGPPAGRAGLPMDDCLAQVAIDFGGRPWLVWEAEFKREKIGEVPTEMFFHFFKSFSDAAKCNLNIKAEGTNEHHKIEAIFKAFAKAIKMAVRKEGDQLPSTKGTL
ncbi:MAG TPA: bifunctional histidinol-phosphatase/imidazoleglycerol-phosphate dehydratase HisB [Cyclobacteriaceae bacterium]|nr:bifunctional histidinol-phosphatase/imidazoleglycerol-phosphate dehydratase HisB [Cyclobacteriaceae bacterium]